MSCCVSGLSQDSSPSKTTLERIIEAHGGQNKLAKVAAIVVVKKGKITFKGVALDFEQTIYAQFPDKWREESLSIIGISRSTSVVAGEKVHQAVDGKSEVPTDIEKQTAKDKAYVFWLTNTLPLKNEVFSISSLSEKTIGNREAIGIRLSRKDYPTVDMYFDIENDLLVQSA
jgi:hypothetical protein